MAAGAVRHTVFQAVSRHADQIIRDGVDAAPPKELDARRRILVYCVVTVGAVDKRCGSADAKGCHDWAFLDGIRSC